MQRTFSMLAIVGAAFVLIVGLTVLMPGQQAQQARQQIAVGRVQVAGFPEDWTHHNVVFSNPGSEEDAIRKGTYEQWLRVVNDPRYILHTLRQRLPAQGPAAEDVARIEEMVLSSEQGTVTANAKLKTAAPVIVNPPVKTPKPATHRDWSVYMGGSGATVGAGNFPAKYSFSINAAPICGNGGTPDYAVYNTSLLGSSTQASLVAYDNLYASCSGQVPSVYWAFNTGGKIVTSVVLSLDGTQLAFVQTPASGSAQLVLLQWAAYPTGHNLTSGATNITNGSTSLTVTSGLSYLDVGAEISGTGIPAGDTIASWTSATAGTLFTAATGNGTLNETLTLTADAGSPGTLTSNPSYPSCTAPCMITLPLSGSGTVTDTLSSPFVDYGDNIIYVGDSSGHLHKFINIFNATTPSEVTTGNWPVTVSGNKLTSPVYDPSSTNIYVADSGGYLYAYNTSGAKVMDSSRLAVNTAGIVQGPLVDSSTGYVYAFVGQDDNFDLDSVCGSGEYTNACSGVFRFPTSNSSTGNTGATCEAYDNGTGWYTGSNCGSEMELGEGTSSSTVTYAGAFDHLYYSGSGNTGTMWGCSSTVACSGCSKLVYLPMSTSFPTGVGFGYSTVYPVNSTPGGTCSPTSEIYGTDGSTNDYVFLSPSANGNQTNTDCYNGTGSDGGCVYSFLIGSSGSTIYPTEATAGINAYLGSSGVIIDNTSGVTGASQIYYSPLGNDSGTTGIPPTCPEVNSTPVGCAVQASQLALE